MSKYVIKITISRDSNRTVTLISACVRFQEKPVKKLCSFLNHDQGRCVVMEIGDTVC